jgi:asparagine synthase (glutamine-hydrolysing)
MCGIAGQFNFKGEADQALVREMTERLAHRGPDGEGFHFSGPVGLGIRRLKIIDLVTGDQPIYNEDKTVWVVLNGEIYNYPTLRETLIKQGHTFYTQSDTEVIAHIYEEKGERFAESLEGMFGIALWDEKKQTLFLARDRAGEKPLYYCHNGTQLLFASELKAILASPRVQRTIDPEALHYYFVYGRVPSPLSIFKGVKKLEPATVARVQGGALKTKTYWHPSFAQKFTLAEDDIAGELLKHLKDAVRKTMIADVPIGAFLSGGVDSSAVVALMAEHSPKPVETFSAGFREKDFSELRYARLVSERFGTNHHEFVIEPEVLEVLPKLVRHLDEPFADASIIPTFYVAEATRRSVTVALTGDGGDELFAGYEWFKALKLARRYNVLPEGAREFVYAFTKLLPDTDERERWFRWLHKIKRFAETQRGAGRDVLGILLAMTAGFTEEDLRKSLYAPEFAALTARADAENLRRELVKDYDGDDPLEAALYGQFRSLLPDMFFTKVDRCSMAVSLETRAPFMHRPLVEFAAKIPFRYKLKGLKTKYIFKRALRGVLPDTVLDRPKKGFGLPIARWLREERIRKNVEEALYEKRFASQGFFKMDYVRRLVERHTQGKENNAEKIWRLYAFALWWRTYLT